MTPKKPGAKKGAKKANTNAVKNTIYSKFIAVVDPDELDAMPKDNFREELKLARAQLVARLTKRDNENDPEMEIKLDAGVRHYLQIVIEALTENANNRVSEKMVFTSLMEAMRVQNDKQHVQR